MKFLILSYHFPPHPTVGSRRWAKFAKYLARMGHEVSVITSRAPRGSSSPWDGDVEAGLKVRRVPPRYPRILDTEPETFFQKAWYKVCLAALRGVCSGNPYDRALFWEKPIRRAFSDMLRDEGPPDVILANGPPFRVLWYATRLKQLSPRSKVLCDFRDPWTWWGNMGYATLGRTCKAAELRLERDAVVAADFLSTPAEDILENLAHRYPDSATKISLLPHGFDPVAIQPNSIRPRSSPPRRFIYYGSLYPGTEPAVRTLIGRLSGGPARSELDVYSFTRKYEEIFHEADPERLVVRLHSPIPEREILSRLESYDAAVHFTFPGVEHFVSTKYLEIIRMRLPILLIGPAGKASRFIVDNRLGLHVSTEDPDRVILRWLAGEIDLRYNDRYDTAPFSFERLTEKLVSLVGAGPSRR
jgi:glycosyltransferase involved in cell wall biosynthesis